MVNTTLPLLTDNLAREIIAHERLNFVTWAQAIAAQDGNPYGAHIERFGGATLILNKTFRAPVFNRVFEMSLEDVHRLPHILACFADYGVRPMFDISPYHITPYTSGENLLAVLAKYGLQHGGFHQMVYGVPNADAPLPPAHIEISTITDPHSADADAFEQVYAAYAGDGRVLRLLIGHPNYTCYLARIEGQPAAVGLLHVDDGVGSMATGVTLPAYRGLGCQTALLNKRMQDAAHAGCTLIVSQCQPGTSSQNNQLRVGLQIGGTKVWWTTPT